MRILALLLMLLLTVDIHAQQRPPRHIIMQFERPLIRTLNVIKEDFRQVLTREEVALLDSIRIRIDSQGPNSWVITNLHTYQDGNIRGIVIPIGFVIAMDPIEQAMAFSVVAELPPEDVTDYTNDVVKTVRENTRRIRSGQPPQPLTAFPDYMGYTRAEAYDIYSQPGYAYILEEIKLGTWSLIFGHELAHQLKGHLEDSHSSYADEEEADAFAIEVSLAAEYNPLMSYSPFLFFAAAEGGSAHIYHEGRSHPPPACRLLNVIRLGAKAAMEDEEFVEFMESIGRGQALEAVDELEALMKEEDVCQ